MGFISRLIGLDRAAEKKAVLRKSEDTFALCFALAASTRNSLQQTDLLFEQLSKAERVGDFTFFFSIAGGFIIYSELARQVPWLDPDAVFNVMVFERARLGLGWGTPNVPYDDYFRRASAPTLKRWGSEGSDAMINLSHWMARPEVQAGDAEESRTNSFVALGSWVLMNGTDLSLDSEEARFLARRIGLTIFEEFIGHWSP